MVIVVILRHAYTVLLKGSSALHDSFLWQNVSLVPLSAEISDDNQPCCTESDIISGLISPCRVQECKDTPLYL